MAEVIECGDCDGDGFMLFHLPGDGTACVEEYSVKCSACEGTGKVEG